MNFKPSQREQILKPTLRVGLTPRYSLSAILWFSIAFLFSSIPLSRTAQAYSVGAWHATCVAPNRITGKLEPVEERIVDDYLSKTWYARTLRVFDGGWRIEFNRAGMNTKAILPYARMFVFFHECAHARLNSPSERLADCEAMHYMNLEMHITLEHIRQIQQSYRRVRRKFPTGGPCHRATTVERLKRARLRAQALIRAR